MLRRHEAVLEESMSVRGIQALEAILGGLDKSIDDSDHNDQYPANYNQIM